MRSKGKKKTKAVSPGAWEWGISVGQLAPQCPVPSAVPGERATRIRESGLPGKGSRNRVPGIPRQGAEFRFLKTGVSDVG